MLNKELEKIAREGGEKGMPAIYVRNSLKEYLQIYVLYSIYTSPEFSKNLIFTGGTCLRHFYGLQRLSEDLDFDYIEDFAAGDLLKSLEDFFRTRLKYSEVAGALKQSAHQILLKFPVLKGLGLAKRDESDLLYIKIDLSKKPSDKCTVLATSLSKYGLNFVARHYDLPDLMAGKVHAILTRRFFRGKDDKAGIKGRDYFDLLWFVKKGVRPNLERLEDMLGEKLSAEEVERKLDIKVEKLANDHKSLFKADIIPFISDPKAIGDYVENYYDEYQRFKAQSFTPAQIRPDTTLTV